MFFKIFFSDANTLYNTCCTLNIPGDLLTSMAAILDSEQVRGEAWCQQILIDLVAAVHSYLASNTIDAEKPSHER